MNWAWATSLDQIWRSTAFPMWLTLAAAGLFRIIVPLTLLRAEKSLRTVDLTVVTLLAARDHCTAADCPAFRALTDYHQIVVNMDERTYEGLIARYAPMWNVPPPTAPVAALAPSIPTGKPTNAEFPSAASTPPVSIMTPEPGTSAARAAAAAPAASAPGPSPRPATSALAAAKKPAAPKAARTTSAPGQLAPAAPVPATPAPPAANNE